MRGRDRTPFQRWRDGFRRRERLWIGVYLLGAIGALFAFAWLGIARQGAERWVSAWDERFARRLAACEQALEAGQLATALPALVRLDREHPARTTIHARDRERERVLTLLGRAWVAAGKKRRALETFDRLVAFDPLNWANHWERAEARLRLGEADAALAGYADVLAIHPSHLPSVRATIALHAEAGRFAEVAATYEAYLAAWHLAALEVELTRGAGEPEVLSLDVPADGRPHRVELPLTRSDGFAGRLTLSTRGYSSAVHALGWRAGRVVGAVAPEPERRVAAPAPLEVFGGELVEGTLVARSSDSGAAFALEAPPGGGAGLWIELSVFKAVDEETWARVTTACRNLVAEGRLEAARARTRVGGCLAGGSVVLP